jgi:hypothetical protein
MIRRSARIAVRSTWASLPLAAGLLLASSCNGALLEIGSADGGRKDAIVDVRVADEAAPPMPLQPSCPSMTDSENKALRGATCEESCSQGLTPGRDLSDPGMMAASLTATWTFCSGALGPPGTTGVWVLSNCGIIFEPVSDHDGGAATYDVVTTDAGVATGIVLHLATGDLFAEVAASMCLGRAQLSFDGGTVEMASLSPPDASTAK